MSKRKSIVPLNKARDSFNLFQNQLVPTITDVRGETVEVDLGDYLHGILDHPEMPERVNGSWIRCAIRQKSAATGIGGCDTARST